MVVGFLVQRVLPAVQSIRHNSINNERNSTKGEGKYVQLLANKLVEGQKQDAARVAKEAKNDEESVGHDEFLQFGVICAPAP